METLSQVKQSTRWVECIELEEQRGKLKSYVSNIAFNLWGCDVLLQWNAQINTPPILETNHTLMYDSWENIRRDHKK